MKKPLESGLNFYGYSNIRFFNRFLYINIVLFFSYGYLQILMVINTAIILTWQKIICQE